MHEKSKIIDIIYGKMDYTNHNYFENISYSLTQIQMAAVKGLKVSCLCFELTGEMLLEVRRLMTFGKKKVN